MCQRNQGSASGFYLRAKFDNHMFDMFKMLGKLNDIKASAKEVKEELKNIELEASDNAEMVKVRVTGDKRILDVTIDPSALFPEKKEEMEAAVKEATSRALQLASDKSKELIKTTINDKYPEVAGMDLGQWLG